MKAIAEDLAQAQLVKIKSFGKAKLEIQEAMVDAFQADADGPAVLFVARLRVAGHGETFAGFFGNRGGLGHRVSAGAVTPAGAACGGARMSSSANCKSCRRA